MSKNMSIRKKGNDHSPISLPTSSIMGEGCTTNEEKI
jgi:hypothetical protein